MGTVLLRLTLNSFSLLKKERESSRLEDYYNNHTKNYNHPKGKELP
jgi:hypothetical protein